MSSDIPAEFLPALPAARVRTSVGVRDARVETMMAAMQQRPISGRRESVDSQGTRARGQSVDRARMPSMDRPASITIVERPMSVRSIPVAVPERPGSMRSSFDGRAPRLELRDPVFVETRDDDTISVSSGGSRGSRVVAPENLPMAMAQAEPLNEPAYAFKTNLPPSARSFTNNAGNRNTLTLSDEELALRLHEQLNAIPTEDGQIVTAEIVQQEVMDRRAAEDALDQEIAALENAVLARQLSGPHLLDDAGQAEDDAFRERMALNEKLDYMRPESHKPVFSALIFLVTSIAMVAEIVINGGVEPFGINPTFGPKPETLLQMGAKRTDLILAGEWWRLFLPIILHAGILHLLFNMLGLWNIGVPMEREFGSWRIAAIYISSGLFGVLLSCLFAPKLTSVGASGAVFGLMGACAADLTQNWSLYKGSQIRMLIQLVLMIAFNVILGLMPFLDNFAHVGGLLCGCVLGLGLLVQTRYYYSGVKKRKRVYQIVLMVLSFIGIPSMFIAGYLVLFLSIPIDCDWCSYISCVPMPPNVPYDQLWWSCDECSQGGLNGNIEPVNNTLSFNCPSDGASQSRSFPNTTTIDTNLLIQTCLELCSS